MRGNGRFFAPGRFYKEKHMLIPDYSTFKDHAQNNKRTVVYREIAGDCVTPISLLINFSDEDSLFLLESANIDKSFSRYTFFGIKPEKTIQFKDKTLIVKSGKKGIEFPRENPVDYINSLVADASSHKEENLGDFCGGLVGFMGYDMVNYMDLLRRPIKEDTENSIMLFFQINEFYVFDNKMGKFYAACSIEASDDLEGFYAYAEERTLEMASEILHIHKRQFNGNEIIQKTEDFNRQSFMKTVKDLKSEIINGECIQTVLSNKYEIKCDINPVNLYRTLRNINPSPYMFYIKHGDEILCGTSPEVHLKLSGNIATLKPIAGTYRINGQDVEEIKRGLLADEKERAEHLMLLDLARNDLYSGCVTDSVAVTGSFEAEVYSHLVHIVSEVQGEKRDDISPIDLFCRTFPAGTVTGAPKVRAMELIDEYEISPRGFYAGCAGYFSYSQDIDTCIIIRSALLKKDTAVLRAGAGIVYDSVPDREFDEVEVKLGALNQSLGQLQTLEKKNVFDDR